MTPTKCEACASEHYVSQYVGIGGNSRDSMFLCVICAEQPAICTRIRERRAEGARSRPDMEVIIGSNFGVFAEPIREANERIVTAFRPIQITGTISLNDPEFTLDVAPPTCRTCSAVATHEHWCVYCSHATTNRAGQRRTREQAALDHALEGPDTELRNQAARARNLAALEGEKAKSTRTSREMAKRHPSTWPSNEGED